MEYLKKVIRSSFNNSFFVSHRNESSEEYLDVLTNIAVERGKINKNDYKEVAERICEYDSRIKQMYSEWDVYISIPLLEYSDIFIELYYKRVESFDYELSNQSLRRMQKIIPDQKGFLSAIIIYLVILNYSHFSATDKESILSLIEKVVNDNILVKSIKQNRIYNVHAVTDNISENIILQIVLYKYCLLTDSIFNHQTPYSLEVFFKLDKDKMYFDIRELIINGFEGASINCDDDYGLLLSKLIGYKIAAPTEKINDYGMLDYYHEWVSSDQIRSLSLLKTIFDVIELRNCACKELLSKCKELGIIKSENKRLRTTIEELTVSKKQKEDEITRIIRNNENKQKALEKQIKTSDKEKNELYALREFIFTLGKDVPTEEDCSQCLHNDCIDYSEIVIIGGHIKWAQKVKEHIPDIEIISAEQKRVDINFIQNKKIVLFFINYLSHSLYLQVISKIQSNQKIAFIKQRNVKDIIEEIKRIYRMDF